MARYLKLMKLAGLVFWNLALIALFFAVPMAALFKAGWFAAAFMAGLAALALVLRHPAFLWGAGLGAR